jgi:hypothetical protein
MLDIICVTYGQNEELKCFINSIKCQTSKEWMLYIVHDGINEELQEDLKSNGYLNDKVRFIQTKERYGLWGHPNRKWALENLAKNEYVLITNGDNYYTPTMVEDVLKRTEDFIYFNCIHSHLLRCVGNTDKYQTLYSELQNSHIDMGCVVIRTALAQKAGFNSMEFAADWFYFEDVLKLGVSTFKIDRFLFVHN